MRYYKKIFFDTEFTSLTQDADLLSLAMVAETGEQFYAERTDYEPQQINNWVQENVLAHFYLEKSDDYNPAQVEIKAEEAVIANAIRIWLQQFEKSNPHTQFQFWADCPAWDWVLFCQLFGGSFGRPANIHFMCMDLATVFQIKGYAPDYERKDFLTENHISIEGHQHNALYDALITQQCYNVLTQK